MSFRFPTLALLSDLHIDADPAWTRYGCCPADHLRSIVPRVVASGAEAVLIAGDCSSLRGEPQDYVRLAELLAPLGRPVHAIAGNHDAPDAMKALFPGGAEGGGDLRHCIDAGAVRWLLVDTRDRTGGVAGEVDAAERAWIEERLDGDRPVILVGHHHPEDCGRDDVDADIGLADTPAFLAWLDARPGILAYLHGHSHSWRAGVTPGGTVLVNLPPTSFPFRPERPLGWVLAETGETAVRLTLQGLDPLHPAHGSAVSVPFLKSSRQ